jgi:hypothetical protein
MTLITYLGNSNMLTCWTLAHMVVGLNLSHVQVLSLNMNYLLLLFLFYFILKGLKCKIILSIPKCILHKPKDSRRNHVINHYLLKILLTLLFPNSVLFRIFIMLIISLRTKYKVDGISGLLSKSNQELIVDFL